MRIKKIHIFLLIVYSSVFYINSSFAQSAYQKAKVFLKKGDTIDVNLNTDKIIFGISFLEVKDESNLKERLALEGIRGFKLDDGLRYDVLTFSFNEREITFSAKLLIDGKYRLYQESVNFFIEADGNLIQLTTNKKNKYKFVLDHLFQDCKQFDIEVPEGYEHTILPKKLVDLILYYYQCIGWEDYQIYVTRTQITKFTPTYRLLLGTGFSQFNLKTNVNLIDPNFNLVIPDRYYYDSFTSWKTFDINFKSQLNINKYPKYYFGLSSSLKYFEHQRQLSINGQMEKVSLANGLINFSIFGGRDIQLNNIIVNADIGPVLMISAYNRNTLDYRTTTQDHQRELYTLSRLNAGLHTNFIFNIPVGRKMLLLGYKFEYNYLYHNKIEVYTIYTYQNYYINNTHLLQLGIQL